MAKANLRPLRSHILVEPEQEDQATASGIVIAPTANKEKPQRGKVVELGTGGLDNNGNEIKFTVKQGDVVLFKKYAPDEFEIDGKTYLVMDESDVLAIVN